MDISVLFYTTHLGRSLKNSLHKFDKEDLLADISLARDFYDEALETADFPYDYRIKSLESCRIKYDRYYPNYAVERTYNDLFGARMIVDDYSQAYDIANMKPVRESNMILGKRLDDGYRGLHLYYQPDHFVYPIEFQFNTAYDRRLNDWLHSYLYKKGYVPDIGGQLRKTYESGRIQSEDDFRRELHVLLSGK
ncbi:hypothetical protein [Selenomonas ruminantium]|uniref:Putative GTP pyrophosphokinase n=1 Tax=Selenomonas ruminantium TaxID=971 RepID=A0A1H0PG28_SELRU|nr:hypothetical protein [Selenomonas ruminantium]SDP03605.1 putative GTP pyrophosphokinase [Selenomonas ruminantium]